MENTELKMKLWNRFKIVGDELAHGMAEHIAEYIPDDEKKSMLEVLAKDGCSLMIRVKMDKPTEIPDVGTMGKIFDSAKGEYLDLVVPMEVGKQIFKGL